MISESQPMQGANALSQQSFASRSYPRHFQIPVFLIISLLISVGCNSGVDLVNVTGRITEGGKPKPDALVTFTPTDGRRMSLGRSDQNGQYRMEYTVDKDGALTGHHSVTIADVKKPTEALLTKEVDVGSGSSTFDFDLSEASAQQKK
jgi:hypothetical protein